ncbi:hypothetical protein HZF05_07215 [Sphingomonas sp. CGMCC 1.13654]|uniref:Uncharacterized protein n=1 Tax=Sphingomonas chungangi TaxID=2683589 RepID=A0A838L8N6_9SPHN|nr:hypothetical protein [Sphingomonas chungangi]MBA2933888.1 hypothetical protein [Sphingomonas chungangi]MVW55217.1 hypothetical protein [Sphingomonas chungangi]
MTDGRICPSEFSAEMVAHVRAVLMEKAGSRSVSREMTAALVAVLTIDMRMAGGTADTPTDDQIVQSAWALRKALDGKSAGFTLPHGTPVVVGRPGSLEIAGQTYVCRSQLQGLHPIQTVPRDAHGFNLSFLRGFIYSGASSSSAKNLGLPLPVQIGDRGMIRHLLDFPPHPELGGAILRCDLEDIDAARFCSAPGLSIERFAKTIVKSAQWVWRHRARIASRVEATRKAAQLGIAAARRAGASVVIAGICIDARSIGQSKEPTLNIDYHGLDEALRPGRLTDVVRGDEPVENLRLYRAPVVNACRRVLKSRLSIFEADGLIDDTAAAIVRGAPEGEAAVLHRLSRDLETVVRLPGTIGSAYFNLFWREGVIRAEPATAEGLTLWQGVTEHGRDDKRAEALLKVVRMSVGDDESAFGNTDIAGAEDRLLPSAGILLVNTASGIIWREPVNEEEFRSVWVEA